jgi:hypothetical protein
MKYLENQLSSFSSNVPEKIWEAGRSAYFKISGEKNETIAQEFWNPGEIISILSELNPSHPAVINSINLLP